MKKYEKQYCFRNAYDCGKNKKNRKIFEQQSEIFFSEMKTKRSGKRKRDRRKKNAIKHYMYGKIKRNRDKRTRHAINREKYRKTSAERIRAKNDHDRSNDQTDGMNARNKQKRHYQRMLCDPFEKNQKHAAIGKANASDKTFATVQMIVIYCGRFDKHDSENRSCQK